MKPSRSKAGKEVTQVGLLSRSIVCHSMNLVRPKMGLKREKRFRKGSPTSVKSGKRR